MSLYLLGCTGGAAAESLDDFYDWLLLWETPAATAAGAATAAAAEPAAPYPMLQPPPISLLRQAEEWCLLEDKQPPENYLEVSIHPKCSAYTAAAAAAAAAELATASSSSSGSASSCRLGESAADTAAARVISLLQHVLLCLFVGLY